MGTQAIVKDSMVLAATAVAHCTNGREEAIYVFLLLWGRQEQGIFL